jgi:hypothetical protein
MIPQIINVPWATAITDNNSADGVFIPATGWMSASQVKDIRVVWELIALLVNLGVRPAYQVSDSVNGSLTTFPIETAFKNSTALHYPTQWHDASANVAGKQNIRFGWQVKNTSAAVITAGRMAGKFEMNP